MESFDATILDVLRRFPDGSGELLIEDETGERHVLFATAEQLAMLADEVPEDKAN
jgi:hypothetical protein